MKFGQLISWLYCVAELPPALRGEDIRVGDGPEEERVPHEHRILFCGCSYYWQWSHLLGTGMGELLSYGVFLHVDG